MSPFRQQHSCTIDETVTDDLVIESKNTKLGVVKVVRGIRANGTKGVRAIRVSADVGVFEAQRMCTALGGQFFPATPLDPRKQLLDEKSCVSWIYAWVKDFEMPFKRIQLADWSSAQKNDLPDSCFALILPGGKKDTEGKTVPRSLRKLPYKNADGTVNKSHLQNALARVNQINVPAALKQQALIKLLRFAKAYGMKVQEKSKFKLSDLDFFMALLVEAEKGR